MANQESVSPSRHTGAAVRQKDKPWIKLGLSRATWYRYGKPTDQDVVNDLIWERRPSGKLADSLEELKRLCGVTSIRSYQRVMRVMNSELGPYLLAGHISAAKADKILANPEWLQRVRLEIAKAKADIAKAKGLSE